MTSQQLDERAIFSIARRLDSPDARAEYLQQVCGDDHALRNRVLTLLRGLEEGGSFLESPAQGVAATIDFPPIAERPGTQIGPYKLHQEIGEGGMGIVYMAIQKEPVRRKVALKIIKPGLDTREVIDRLRDCQSDQPGADHHNDNDRPRSHDRHAALHEPGTGGT